MVRRIRNRSGYTVREPLQENQARIREIIALLTERQSDIARLDAAS